MNGTNGSVSITLGSPIFLAFSQQPGGGSGGAAWTTQPSVSVEYGSSSVVTWDSSSVTLAIGTNPGSGTLSCTGGLSLATTSGVAAFAGCEINNDGTGYTLTATDSTDGITAAVVSNTFNIENQVNFATTGSHTLTIPAGVTTVNFTIYGAGGGGTDQVEHSSTGGNGQEISGTITLASNPSGTTLTVVVGGGGGGATGNTPGTAGSGGTGDAAGGTGGNGTSEDGAGGGGATDIYVSAGTIVLAAGGGGSGGYSDTDVTNGTSTSTGPLQAGATGSGGSYNGGGGGGGGYPGGSGGATAGSGTAAGNGTTGAGDVSNITGYTLSSMAVSSGSTSTFGGGGSNSGGSGAAGYATFTGAGISGS